MYTGNRIAKGTVKKLEVDNDYLSFLVGQPMGFN